MIFQCVKIEAILITSKQMQSFIMSFIEVLLLVQRIIFWRDENCYAKYPSVGSLTDLKGMVPSTLASFCAPACDIRY